MPTYPTFVETKHIVVDEYQQIGQRCSARKAHSITRALFAMRERGGANWSREEAELVKDPTGREAIRRVMARLNTREEAA